MLLVAALAATSFGAPAVLDGFGRSDLAVASDASGTAVLVGTRPNRDTVLLSERPAGGAWGTPLVLRDGARRPREVDAAAAGRGAAALAWVEDGRTTVVVREPGAEAFGAPIRLGGRGAQRPQVAVDRRGRTLVTWLQGGVRQVPGGWNVLQPPRAVVDAAGRPVVVWGEDDLTAPARAGRLLLAVRTRTTTLRTAEPGLVLTDAVAPPGGGVLVGATEGLGARTRRVVVVDRGGRTAVLAERAPSRLMTTTTGPVLAAGGREAVAAWSLRTGDGDPVSVVAATGGS